MRSPMEHAQYVKHSPRALLLALALALVAACGATAKGRGQEPRHAAPSPPRPWTSAFLRPAVLIADEIRVEGPEELLQHFASLQDPETTVYTTRTTAEGLLQETVVRPGMGGAEIGGQLDALELRALRRLVVLQRFDDSPVLVRASGNAYWASAAGGEERRQGTLTLRGVLGE